ncbi:MarR family transcriptional regulator [Bordetella ansorpii]|uniref:MarR family transcriptional regulator n=1 Tax=Bordetella ansorpii TaxID=288768 RepID=A0A157P7U1_9BORD|nr:MarR family transcriptional regulator [Bordetella ansorpii]SAI29518.1 MarR family transcriptional regulator [Bordetella ansorpii]
MPDTPRARFGSLLSQTSRAWRRAVNRRLQPYGLTEATWLPLVHLSRAQTPMRQKDLAASLGLDGSSVVRLLDALQAAGLITRREEDGDRRAKAIVLTPQGQATVEQVEQVAAQVRAAALADIPDPELQRAFDLLQGIVRRLEAETETEDVQ